MEKEGRSRSTVPSASVELGEEPEMSATFHSAAPLVTFTSNEEASEDRI